MTAIEWLNEQLQEMDSKYFNNLIQIEMGRDNYNHIVEESKEMEKQEKHAEYMRGWKDGYSKNETFKNTNK